MATFTKLALSGSTNGKQIKVGATSTPGTSVHTAVSSTADYDEIWLWAVNQHTVDVQITVEWGGSSSPDDNMTTTLLPKAGLTLIVPGLVLNNGLSVRVFASVANVVMISGFVNRITA